MPENLLTDLKVRSAKSTDRDWKLSNGGGLFLLVKPTGGKLWRRAAAQHRDDLVGCDRASEQGWAAFSFSG
ncbi:Arm DNA-binding domain-containing protein [Paenalcaligenes niemegkensis]|uniref:Arm DNA-binding domain-containing protein n=1 Tax=Paenalcaligenes niemegkensis TaxID=2895469 RepID=UPI001EE95358|nr:Arm DNA-binding domain-containing protein [Paenalcaligenes niemegkensis]MCQ9618227.1 Arm DNA-binding domain-containing protein [Paenalcaligenes niemegkensis]